MTQMQKEVVRKHLQVLPDALGPMAMNSWNKLETGITVIAGYLISLEHI